MDVRAYNRASYLQRRRELNVILDDMRRRQGLGAAIRALIAQQRDCGFIEDDLATVRHYRIRHPNDTSRSFSVQYNPRRAMRHLGAGRPQPPSGTTVVNGGCFLCDENVAWQQRGLEVGFDITIADAAYCCYANPFPLMPSHVTVATKAHVPQGWSTAGDGRRTVQGVVSHLLALAAELPSFVVFFNGPGAGASIPAHFHYQVFERSPEYAAFPLERSPMRAVERHLTTPTLKDYPITVACFDGAEDSIVERASAWLLDMASRHGGVDTASANLIATRAAGRTTLFVTPRHRALSHAPGFAGLVGGLEILGELVLSTEQEKEDLDRGRIDYARVASVLRAVEPLEQGAL